LANADPISTTAIAAAFVGFIGKRLSHGVSHLALLEMAIRERDYPDRGASKTLTGFYPAVSVLVLGFQNPTGIAPPLVRGFLCQTKPQRAQLYDA
jgi:hypothetical protein